MLQKPSILCMIIFSIITYYQVYSAYSKEELNKNGIFTAKNRKFPLQSQETREGFSRKNIVAVSFFSKPCYTPIFLIYFH